jgi:uncharacterized protein DUF4145
MGAAALWRHDQLVYPPARLVTQPHPDMPSEVRVLYEEAAAVGPVSRRAGAVLARATVERLIKHLDPDAPKGANLDKRIERIKARGVSTSVGEMLDVVRVTGNHALHVDDQPGELVVLPSTTRTVPMRTSGFGLGIERFLLWVLGHDDIRDIPLVPRGEESLMWPESVDTP